MLNPCLDLESINRSRGEESHNVRQMLDVLGYHNNPQGIILIQMYSGNGLLHSYWMEMIDWNTAPGAFVSVDTLCLR